MDFNLQQLRMLREVARLKKMSSEWGAHFDDLVDWLRWQDHETITWSSANEFYRQTLTKATAPAPASSTS